MTDDEQPIEPPSESTADEAGTTGGRAKRAAIVAVRVVRGTVAVWVAVAVILIVGLVPLPTVAITPPSVEVVPVPADQLRLCAGSLMRLGDETGQDAGTAEPLGSPSVRVGSIDGTADRSTLESESSADPTLFRLEPSQNSRLSAAQSQLINDQGFTGLAGTACAEPSGSIWLVGGATTVGRTTLLTLGNPTEVDAMVTLTIHGEEGAVQAPGMTGINVPAGSQRVLSLAGFAPDVAAPIVHVEARGGRVTAWLQQSTTRVLDPGGVDLVGESVAPAETQVIPGIRVIDAVAASRIVGREDYGDLAPTVRIAVPGDESTVATVSVTPDDPALTGTSFEIQVAAGAVVDVPIDAGSEAPEGEPALADGGYTVTVTADEPVLAGVRVSTAQESPAARNASPFAPPIPPVTDFAWLAAAPALSGDTLVTIAPGPAPRLTAVNPTDAPVELLLAAQGGADIRLTVPAGASASVDVVPDVSYLLTGAEGLHATVSYAAVGQLAGYPVVSARPGSHPIVVHP